LAGATALMALAIAVAMVVERIPFNVWLWLGVFLGAFLTAILRAVRRVSLAALGGGPIFQLWLLARFIVAPALFLVTVALIGSLPFRAAASEILFRALALLGLYGGLVIFATAILADVAALLKARRRDPPADC
jgi:hypothetical protein